MSKHIPLRRCVVCRETLPQKELLRLSQRDGQWQFDLKRKADGRGAWLCFKPKCHGSKQLKRFFRNDAERIAQELETIKTALGEAFPVVEVTAKNLDKGRSLGGMNVR
ncbi:MAG: YlxR family protein [Trueperaceae bacterium]